MKFVLTFAVLIFGLGLMSFSVGPENGITRLGDQLYQVDETTRYTEADRATLLSTIATEYNLGDWRKVTEDFYSDGPVSARANWILKKKAFIKAIKEQFIKYDDVKSEGLNVQPLEEIMVRYSN